MSKPTKRILVKATEIMQITGWSKHNMRKARNLGWVKMIKEDGQIFYDLNSLVIPVKKTA